MLRFSLRLVRPYWRWLLVVAVAMVVETVMSLAQPRPLKIVLDSVFGSEPAPALLTPLVGEGADALTLLNLAVGATVVIALLQAANAYLNAFYTVSIGQWVAHDLRQSVYAHLQRRSMSYYDRHQTGPIISTITDDINAVQDFVSTSLLDIVIDSLTIVGMVAVMLSLNWRFTLVALAVMPALASTRNRSTWSSKVSATSPRAAPRSSSPTASPPFGTPPPSSCSTTAASSSVAGTSSSSR